MEREEQTMTVVLIDNDRFRRINSYGKSRVKDTLGLVFKYKIRPVAHHSPVLSEKLQEAFKQADGDKQWWSKRNVLCIHYIADGTAVNIGIHGTFCDLLDGIFPGKMKMWCSKVNLDNSETKINRNGALMAFCCVLELIWKTGDQMTIGACRYIPSNGIFTDEEMDNELTTEELKRCHFAAERAEANRNYVTVGEVGITWTL